MSRVMVPALRLTAIIPAWQEAAVITTTIHAVRAAGFAFEFNAVR
jgi:hypothetical protein